MNRVQECSGHWDTNSRVRRILMELDEVIS